MKSPREVRGPCCVRLGGLSIASHRFENRAK